MAAAHRPHPQRRSLHGLDHVFMPGASEHSTGDQSTVYGKLMQRLTSSLVLLSDATKFGKITCHLRHSAQALHLGNWLLKADVQDRAR